MPIILPIIYKDDPKGLKDAQDNLDKFGGVLKGIGVAAGVAFAAAGAAAIAFGASSLKAAAESEAIGRGLENAAKNAGVFGDSASAINAATTALDKHSTALAEMTGIDDEIINQIKTGWLAVPSLAAMGTEGINHLADVTADVAAGTGKDVQAIGLAFQRVAGDTESAFSKLTRAGIVFTDEQKSTFDSLLSTNGEMAAQEYLIGQLGEKYAGAAAAAANPFERLKVIFENLQETVGKALLPAIEAIVPVVQDFIGKLTGDPAFTQFLTTLATTFMSLLDAIMPLMEPITDLILMLLPEIMTLFESIVPLIMLLVDAFMPLIEGVLPPLVDLLNAVLPIFVDLMLKVITPLIPIIVKLVESFAPMIEKILPPLVRLIEALIPVVFALIDAFLPLIDSLLPPLLDLFLTLNEPLLALLEKILPPLTEIIKGFGDVIKWLVDNMIKPAVEWITTLYDAFNKFLGLDGKSVTVRATGISYNNDGSPNRDGNPATPMALGGIVLPRPGGTLAQIGEAGKAEAVIPLDRLDSMIGSRAGGSGATYNINVNAGMGADGASIGEQIVTAIRKYERTSGRVFAAA